jgi:hypothetical protein
VVFVWCADAIVVLHLAYIAFIPLGGFLAWRWRWVAVPHIAAVVIGLTSITVGFDCPLTTWEQSLRRRGGQRPYRDGFVAHYLTGRVYPHGADTAVQLLFAGCVVVAYAGLVVQGRHSRRVAVGRA